MYQTLIMKLQLAFTGALLLMALPAGAVGSLQRSEILAADDPFTQHAQPVLESRCVACHACFNAPCQLNLSSYEGVKRGASQVKIYDFAKLNPRQPTRLLQDAHSTAEWREKGFYPVLKDENTQQRGQQSIWDYLIYQAPGIESGKQAEYHSEQSRACMTDASETQIKNFNAIAPAGRMPFGLPKLSQAELNELAVWRQQGADGPDTQQLERKIAAHEDLKPKITRWEAFFNRESMQAQLSSRYIYEHLFLAHIYFEDQPDIFFRLVRSATKQGSIVELATRYPFDDPGQTFYYRLRPVTQTLVHKNHIPFPFSAAKMKTWNAHFYDATWDNVPTKMPPYGRPGSNPYKTFASIPTEARYRWLLDEAGYHVMNFIKGPVCRGQVALNVINDHFWVMFVDPKKDISVVSPKISEAIADSMQMPAAIGSDFDPTVNFRDKYWQAVKKKYQAMVDQNLVFDETMLWNGERKNTNALLTVYRHFDTAAVLRGLRGEVPKTVWVIDYQVLESIYYNLVAGYDVFGPALHQINSRLFMEISRIASEDLFLTFLPQATREKIRMQWNQSVDSEKSSLTKWLQDVVTDSVAEKMQYEYAYLGSNIPTAINYSQHQEVKAAFIKHVLKTHYDPAQVNAQGDIFKPSTPVRNLPTEPAASPLQQLAMLPASVIQHLPDAMFLKTTIDGEARAYTVVHNKDHFNVGMLFFEDERRNPANDSLDLLPGAASPYINYMLVLSGEQLTAFTQALRNAKDKAAVDNVLAEFGITRDSPDFWKHYDWFSARAIDRLSNESGWLDLNRYINLPARAEK